MLGLLDRIGNLSDYRHDVIHGYLAEYDPQTELMTFISLDRDPSKVVYKIKERRVPPLKLLELGVDASMIGHQLATVTQGLLAISGRQKEWIISSAISEGYLSLSSQSKIIFRCAL